VSREHHVDRSLVHHDWDNAYEPVLTVASGDVVHLDLPITGEGQIKESSGIDEVVWDWSTIYNLAGPIRVETARPGDTLQIEVLDLTPGPWGWTALIPNTGLLPEDFPDPYLRVFDLRERTTARLTDHVHLPVEPFLGTMGVAPDTPGRHDPFPPHKGGGNVDTRHLVPGSTLWLPVWCDGALFSCGDAHAAQGDGEVCVTAIECAMHATLRFTIHRRATAGPSFRTLDRVGLSGPYHGTMGISPDLMEGARSAVRNMIAWLVDEHELTREDAYILCSLAGDLRIFEIVDAGVWNVGMTLPLAVFRH
jgi:acetamidase/formamidase